MTLPEKIALLHGQGWGAADYVGQTQWSVAKTSLPRIPWINLNDGPQVSAVTVWASARAAPPLSIPVV